MKLTEKKLKQLIEETINETSRLRRHMGRPKPKKLTPTQVEVNKLKKALEEFEKSPMASTSPYNLRDAGDGKLDELQFALSDLNNSDFYNNIVKRNRDNSFKYWGSWLIDKDLVQSYYEEGWDWDEKTEDEQTDLVFDDYLRIYEQNKFLDTQISNLIESYKRHPQWASENKEKFDRLVAAMQNLS